MSIPTPTTQYSWVPGTVTVTVNFTVTDSGHGDPFDAYQLAICGAFIEKLLGGFAIQIGNVQIVTGSLT